MSLQMHPWQVHRKYICTAVCIYLFIYQVYILFGDSTFVHGSLLYMHILCITTAICMYVCLYICMYMCTVITYSNGKDQPGKVVNPARIQLAEQGK